MENLQFVDLLPLRLERAKAPERLDPGAEARVLQRVEVDWLGGRIRRGAGQAATQIKTAAVSVTSAFVGVRRDCRLFVLDCTNGTVRCMTGTSALMNCLGPVEEWTDASMYGSTFDENFDEDAGVSSGGGGCPT